MWYVIKEDELYHHGILGQKWGVRRFQNPDGTLTAEGRKRYDVDIEGAQSRYKTATKKMNDAYAKYNATSFMNPSALQKNADAYDKSVKEVNFAKEDLQAEKIKAKLNARSKDGKSFLKLKDEYMRGGMSEEEAAVAAYKRQRAEKIFAAAAITAASAAVAYATYRHFDRNVDKIIPKDSLMQRVSTSPDLSVQDAFYAARSKGDANTYVGMYGNALEGHGASSVYQKQIRANQDIKIASEKTAKDVLASVASDSDKQALKKLADAYGSNTLPVIVGGNVPARQWAVIQKARLALKSGKITPGTYEFLNYARAGGGDKSIQPLLQKFDSELKNRGYGAIIDVNDKRLSGYNARTATIVVDKGKVTVESARKLSSNEIQKKNLTRGGVAYVKQLFRNYSGLTVAGLLGASGYAYINNRRETKRNDQIVAEYRKEHPETKLSYKEIVRNYERSKGS